MLHGWCTLGGCPCLVDECMLDGYVHAWWMAACLKDKCMFNGYLHAWQIGVCLMDGCMVVVACMLDRCIRFIDVAFLADACLMDMYMFHG